MEDLFSIVIGYLAGSVPFAFLLARRRGVDLRRAGSGNVGASNVLRTSGLPMAIVALCLDGAKGSVAVLVADRLAGGGVVPVAAGFASVVGHIYPMWLGFHGGKGVATAAGVFAVLMPQALAIAAGVFLAAVWATRYISVGSIAGAVTMAVSAAAAEGPSPVGAGAVATALLIVHSHRANFVRIMTGTERRVGQRLQGP